MTKIGRIAVPTPDGETIRLVAVEPENDRVIDLARAFALVEQRRSATPEAARRIALATFPSSLAAAIGSGPRFRESIELALAAADDASTGLADVHWRAAVDAPVIRDGLTFEGHITNFFANVMKTPPNPSIYVRPGYFKGSNGVLYGHDEVIPYPSYTEALDYELEIGYVIGAPGRNLAPEDALDHVFGITIFNDFSARDVQAVEFGIGMGPQKSKDFAYGIGPWVTTLDEVGAIEGLRGQVRVNGEVWSDTVVEDFVYTPSELIAYVSIADRLQPGDVIGSGTMAFGAGVELQRTLNRGDVLELELEKVGTLRSHIATESEHIPWWPEPKHNPHAETGA
ncbi:fumarylacetoacetate hydrolase family protein [uncultured Microbacterium sp.]|uniref:fumarylacetoacetate hydrolase family protein n=1 Tax=uncultured Microbacterium sp. TaxID=191216 RepID=UPI0028D6ECFA|nr:fumarylacetoacetate hydrolase family protein [uncultured Microbacterium sp.]